MAKPDLSFTYSESRSSKSKVVNIDCMYIGASSKVDDKFFFCLQDCICLAVSLKIAV